MVCRIGVWDDGQAGQCMGRCMGNGDVVMCWGVSNAMLYYLKMGEDEEDW